MKMTKTGKTSVDYISYERKITDGASGNNGEWQQAERVVKDTLQDIGKKIEASDSLKQRVDFQLENRLKEEHKMKHMSMKKVIIGVAAACLCLLYTSDAADER